MKKKIICVGGASIDIKCLAQNPIQLGTSNPISTITSLGGVARNVAENLALMTHRIELVSAVGHDQAGNKILNDMHQLGVTVNRTLIIPEAATAHYYAVVEPNGDCHAAYADMSCFDAVTLDMLSETIATWSSDCIVFMDTNLPSTIIQTIMKQQKQQHYLLFIDPVSVAKSNKIPDDLQAAFVIKPNQAEASAMTGIPIQTKDDAIQAGKQLLARGAQHVIISLAAEGVVLFYRDQALHFPAPRVHSIIDVNGAGDAFCAGMLYGLQLNLTIGESCRLGLRAAAFTLQTSQTVAPQVKNLFSDQELAHANIF